MGDVLVGQQEVIEVKILPHQTSAQIMELIALIRTLQLGKGLRVNICIDCKCGLLVHDAHATIWKGEELLVAKGFSHTISF